VGTVAALIALQGWILEESRPSERRPRQGVRLAGLTAQNEVIPDSV